MMYVFLLLTVFLFFIGLKLARKQVIKLGVMSLVLTIVDVLDKAMDLSDKGFEYLFLKYFLAGVTGYLIVKWVVE